MATRAEILTLHRYYIWQDQMRVQFDRLLKVRSTEPEPDRIREFLYLSYWYAGLYVVIEGWRELKLADEEIDRLLDSPNVELLRRYRNGVFHFQRAYYDERFLELIRDGEEVVSWVRALNEAFSRYFIAVLGTP